MKNQEAANVGAGLWKGTGMWAWLLHRITGVALAFYLLAHIWVISRGQAGAESFDQLFETLESPFFVILDLFLLAAVLFHAFNGVRILLFDLGVGIGSQRSLAWAAALVTLGGLGIFVVIAISFLS